MAEACKEDTGFPHLKKTQSIDTKSCRTEETAMEFDGRGTVTLTLLAAAALGWPAIVSVAGRELLGTRAPNMRNWDVFGNSWIIFSSRNGDVRGFKYPTQLGNNLQQLGGIL